MTCAARGIYEHTLLVCSCLTEGYATSAESFKNTVAGQSRIQTLPR